MQKSIVVLLHAGYWLLYSLLWALIILLVAGATRTSNDNPLQTWRFFYFIGSFGLLPAWFGFYTFYTWLFNQFLLRKRIWGLFLVGLPLAITCGFLSGALLSMGFPDFSFFSEGFHSFGPITLILSIIALLNGVVGLIIRGFITWYHELKLREVLTQKNFEMELALVKSQINPHFLFNTLNNIDVLIGKDAERASLYLNKLSDIMRFMLYETKTEKIPLRQELAYIEKYIDLQRIRTAVPNYVDYRVEGAVSDTLMIEPMLFIPLVENAFKHSALREKENAIQIVLQIEPQQLLFTCTNKYKEGAQSPQEYGGLGQVLIQKRLQALYPKKHQLDVFKNGDTYQVKLMLYPSWKSLASS